MLDLGPTPSGGNVFPPDVVVALRVNGDQAVTSPIQLGEGVTLTVGIRNLYLDVAGRVKIIAAATFNASAEYPGSDDTSYAR